MAKRTALTLACCLCFLVSFAQLQNYFGVNFGVHSDVFELSSTEELSSNETVLAFPGFSGSVVGRVNVKKWLSIETGVEYRELNTYQPLVDEFTIRNSFKPGLKVITLPVDLMPRVQFYHNRRSLFGILGFKLGYNRTFGYVPTNSYPRETTISNEHFFAMLNLGAGVEFKFLEDCIWHISLQRSFGSKNLFTSTTIYEDENNNDQSYTITGSGDSWYVNFGMRLPIKNFQDKTSNPYVQ